MINFKKLTRGSIWLVNLDPTVGHEQAKRRPCVVVSADTYNHGCAGLVIVMPITSKKRELYWHIPICSAESGLEKESYIICDQVRNLSVQRFSPKPLGFVTDYTLEQIEERLKVLFHFFSED